VFFSLRETKLGIPDSFVMLFEPVSSLVPPHSIPHISFASACSLLSCPTCPLSLDEVSQELQDFAFTPYNSKGLCCRAPWGSGNNEIMAMDRFMLLIEMMAILRKYCGLDLGNSLLHGYLGCEPRILNKFGLIVMNPWEIFKTDFLQMHENRDWIHRMREGLDEAGILNVERENKIKLRRQFSRMGFRDKGAWTNKIQDVVIG
jgi:hypothetical protein